MTIYQTFTPDAPNLARQLWAEGVRLIGLEGYTLTVSVQRKQLPLLVEYDQDWQLSVVQDIPSLWTPLHDSAYYNGLMIGVFGSIIYVEREDGGMIMRNASIGQIITDKWHWDHINWQWYCDLRSDRPMLVPA